MTLHIVALYPVHIAELEGQSGVRIRRRRDCTWTQVDCDVMNDSGNAMARPKCSPPSTAPPPMFRIQMEWNRENANPPSSVDVVIQPKGRTGPADVEQRVLAPIFNNGRRLVFEFDNGEVLHVARTGEIEVRYIAVDRTTGQVGTRSHGTFHARYMGLAGKCLAQLEGTTELFPVVPRMPRGAPSVPKGEADLSFGPTAGQGPEDARDTERT